MQITDQRPAHRVNPMAGHTHETDHMIVQFASAELQEKLLNTVNPTNMTAIGMIRDDDGNEETEQYQRLLIDSPEAIEKFRKAMADAGEDVTESQGGDIRHLNINLADLGLEADDTVDLGTIDLDENLEPSTGIFSREQASGILEQLWPVPGRLAHTDEPDSIIEEFYAECHLMHIEIIPNAIEEIPDGDLITLRSMLMAAYMSLENDEAEVQSKFDYEFPPMPSKPRASGNTDLHERRQAVNERFERQMERAGHGDIEDDPSGEDMKRSIIYGAASFMRAAAECARRMQQRIHEDDGAAAAETKPAIQQVIFDVAAATKPVMRCLDAAEEGEQESTVRRGKEAQSQIAEIYDAEFEKFNDGLAVTIMPGLQGRVTESTLRMAETVPVDIAGVTLGIIKEQDISGFRRLNPETMQQVDDYHAIYPIKELEILNTVVAYHHEGRKYVQLPYEPHVRGYPAQRAWSDAVAISTVGNHPNEETAKRLREDAVANRSAAEEKVHDISQEHIQAIVDACRSAEMPDGAIREIIANLVMFHPVLTDRLTGMTDLQAPAPSRRNVRKIVSTCRSAGLDEHEIANMLEAIGWNNLKAAGIKLHQTTRKQNETIVQAVEEAYWEQRAGREGSERAIRTVEGWQA